MSAPLRGRALALAALERIKRNPSKWYQQRYRCESACCFAGHVALVVGHRPIPTRGETMNALRLAAFLLLLALSGCIGGTMHNTWAEKNIPDYDGRYDGPGYTRNGQAHLPFAIAATYVSKWVLHNPWPGALLACGFFVGHEMEESKNFTRFEWGLEDSVFDIVTPCAASFTISWSPW